MLPSLESNAGPIPGEQLEWLTSLPASASDAELRAAYDRDGLVHVKGVIPPELVWEMRRKYFDYFAFSGVLKPGTDPTEGIFCGGDPDQFDGPGVKTGNNEAKDSLFLSKTIEAHREPWVQEFSRNEYLHDMVKRLTKWERQVLLKRQLLRSNIPNAVGSATPVHYDQIFLRGGPPTSLTAWVPIGDCSVEGGGLIYLKDSVAIGEALEADFAKADNLSDEERISAFNSNMMSGGMLSRDCAAFGKAQDRKWLIANYEAGDVVFHHALMIHSSAINRDPQNRIRLATDVRFANADAPYDERWTRDFWRPGDGL